MEWITKLTVSSDVDVSITKGVRSNNSKARFSIRFRNRCFASITKNKKIAYAFLDGRMYFKQGDEKSGFSLTNLSTNGDACSLMITRCTDEFIGDYLLQYDPKEKLYFIDVKSKVVER